MTTEVNKLRMRRGFTYEKLTKAIYEHYPNEAFGPANGFGLKYKLRSYFNGRALPPENLVIALANILEYDIENLEMEFQKAYDDKHPEETDVIEGQIDISEVEGVKDPPCPPKINNAHDLWNYFSTLISDEALVELVAIYIRNGAPSSTVLPRVWLRIISQVWTGSYITGYEPKVEDKLTITAELYLLGVTKNDQT